MATSLLGSISFILLLFAVMETNGGPIYDSNLSSDLMDLKSLLAPLEDRLPVEEQPVPLQDEFPQNYDSADISNPLATWTGDSSRPQTSTTFNRGSWEILLQIAQLKNKLRDLQNAPRSMRRSSDCFGGPIDRIGSMSGMGCKSHRYYKEAEQPVNL